MKLTLFDSSLLTYSKEYERKY